MVIMTEPDPSPKERSNLVKKDFVTQIRLPWFLSEPLKTFCREHKINRSILMRHIIEKIMLEQKLLPGSIETMVTKNVNFVKTRKKVIDLREILPLIFGVEN